MTLRNAALLFSAGWAMFWASALGLIAFVPLWLALAILICGLGMIPLATRKAKSQASAAPDASTIAATVKR